MSPRLAPRRTSSLRPYVGRRAALPSPTWVRKAGRALPASGRVVEDDAERVAPARSKRADAMPQLHAIGAARAPYRAGIDGEDRPIALPQLYHHRPRLHARALLGQ